VNQIERIQQFLVHHQQQPIEAVSRALWRDYTRDGRSDVPAALRPYVDPAELTARPRRKIAAGIRQARHGAAAS
jgi:hypothetical protein